MARLNRDPILPGRDIRFKDDDQLAGPAQRISQDEVDDLLYNEEVPTAERLARLRQYRDGLLAQETLDFGADDPRDLLAEIDLAITRLEGGGTMGAIESPLDIDPADHREMLAPDDDLREAIEEEDAESVEDDIGIKP